jgi:transcriptional regulator with XRE-family HTH domain
MDQDATPPRPDEPAEVAWLRRDGFSPLRAWREHLGVTREELARRLGTSPAAVAQFEAAKARPRAATLKKVAAALEVDWEVLRATD